MGTPCAPLPKRQPLRTREEIPEAPRKRALGAALSPELAEHLAAERRAALVGLADPVSPGSGEPPGTGDRGHGPREERDGELPAVAPTPPAAAPGRYAHSVTEPRRIIIEADYYAGGLWWVPTREEREAPLSDYLSRGEQPGKPHHHRSLRLSQELRDALKAWNQSWDENDGFWEDAVARQAWEERGRELAIGVQNELGTEGWEVLYRLGGWVHRVTPLGSWPAETWRQDLLGYAWPDPREAAEEEARVVEWLRVTGQQPGAGSSTPAEPGAR